MRWTGISAGVHRCPATGPFLRLRGIAQHLQAGVDGAVHIEVNPIALDRLLELKVYVGEAFLDTTCPIKGNGVLHRPARRNFGAHQLVRLHAVDALDDHSLQVLFTFLNIEMIDLS